MTDLGELLRQSFASERSATAVEVAGEVFTYGHVNSLVDSLSRELRAAVQPGDLVGGREPYDFLVAYLLAVVNEVPFTCVPPARTAAATLAPSLAVQYGRLVRMSEPRSIARFLPPALVVAVTSGTTGRPKEVLFDHDALMWSAWNTLSISSEVSSPCNSVLQGWGSGRLMQELQSLGPSGLRFGIGMPLSTIAGLTVVNRTMVVGDQLVIPASLAVLDVWRAVSRGGATNIGLPPTTAQELVRLLKCEDAPKHNLLAVGVGGGAVAPSVLSELEELLECPVGLTYGATELGGLCAMARPWDSQRVRWTTVGRTVGSVQVQLRDDGGGGMSLFMRSPGAMIGHIGGGEIHSVERGSWISSGDRARIDEDGHLAIQGRRDFVIQRGGRRIDPSQVEFMLEEHPSIQRAGVIGIASRVEGHDDIAAMVAAVDGFCDVAGLRAWCRHHMPIHLVPRRLVFVAEIPTASDGAIARDALRNAWYARESL